VRLDEVRRDVGGRALPVGKRRLVGDRRPDDPDCWYASASTGPYAAHGRRDPQAVSTGDAASNPGSRSQMAYPSRYLRCHTHSSPLDGCLFAGLADGQLWEIRDRGDNWITLQLGGDRLDAVLALDHATR
jgi:hypothetical protein